MYFLNMVQEEKAGNCGVTAFHSSNVLAPRARRRHPSKDALKSWRPLSTIGKYKNGNSLLVVFSSK
jgi:hypothetical protein